MLTIYTYAGCSTCKNAVKWLKQNRISFEEKPIRETPPTLVELKYVLERRGELKGLFNTSGQDYRALNLKETLPGLSEPQALALLSENGNLVKRPFALDVTNGIALVGFKEGEWQQALLG